LMTNMDQSRIREIYDDFTYARFDRLAEAFDENVDFISHAPHEFFPYLGRHRGRAALMSAFSDTHKALAISSFWPLTVLINDDNAAVSLVIAVEHRSTGKKAQFLGGHFLRFRSSRIIQYCGIIDSLDAVRQLADRTSNPEVQKP
jgi:hypothetical protein